MITFDGESLFNENFIARGMLTIQDITSKNGSLLSWEEAQHKFSLNNCQRLHWIGLIKCIPKSLRTKLYSTPDNFRLANHLRPDMLIVTSKSDYTKLQKSSKYFLTLEKRNKAKSYVLTLLTESGNECTEPSEIMTKFKGFY